MLDSDILAAARAILPALSQIAGGEGTAIGVRLDALLARGTMTGDICDEISDLLSRCEATRKWVLDFIGLWQRDRLFVMAINSRLEDLAVTTGPEWPGLREQIAAELSQFLHTDSRIHLQSIRRAGSSSAARPVFEEIDQWVENEQLGSEFRTRTANWPYGDIAGSKTAELDYLARTLLERLDPPRTACALLNCPPIVVSGREFELEVGLAAECAPGTLGTPIQRPNIGPYVLTVHVVADGFRARANESFRQDLLVTSEHPYPRFVLHLTPCAVETVRPGAIQALFSIAGQMAGIAFRAVTVAANETLLELAPALEPDRETPLNLPHGKARADFEARIIDCGQGRLQWTFDSAWPVAIPAEPVSTSIGESAEAFARMLIERSSTPFVPPAAVSLGMLGIARTIRDQMPTEFWNLLSAVAEKVKDRPLAILILSSEPYVPWELAAVEPPMIVDAPPFLSAQACVGRWILPTRPDTRPHRPKLPPPRETHIKSLVVVSGLYSKRNPDLGPIPALACAREEARYIVSRYKGQSVNASHEDVLACLQCPPSILHFAIHGIYDRKDTREGLLLADDMILDSVTVKGASLQGDHFIFLNACQAGSGSKILGSCAGVAASFLYAGASGVVAPLWYIQDHEAKAIALDFYRRTRSGTPPAEALRQLRADSGMEGQPRAPASLAYLFFGHPAHQFVWPSEGEAPA